MTCDLSQGKVEMWMEAENTARLCLLIVNITIEHNMKACCLLPTFP